MSTGPTERALAVAKQEATELADVGADAVFMTGSHARGDAHEESDLDLRAIGEGRSAPLKRHDEFLVSTSWMTEKEHTEAFEDPSAVGEAVPGWRSSVILHDPGGVAARLKKRAETWSWDEVADRADEWVAAQVTDYAEEVHTLIGNLDQGQTSGAAAIRSQLVLHLAQVMSVHHRLLYESENDLWQEVGKAMGADYGARQEVALGLSGEDFESTCRAALDLFRLAAGVVADLLDSTQAPVVAHAWRLAARAARARDV